MRVSLKRANNSGDLVSGSVYTFTDLAATRPTGREGDLLVENPGAPLSAGIPAAANCRKERRERVATDVDP